VLTAAPGRASLAVCAPVGLCLPRTGQGPASVVISALLTQHLMVTRRRRVVRRRLSYSPVVGARLSGRPSARREPPGSLGEVEPGAGEDSALRSVCFCRIMDAHSLAMANCGLFWSAGFKARQGVTEFLRQFCTSKRLCKLLLLDELMRMNKG